MVHPIVRMFHAEIRDIVDRFSWDRFHTHPHRRTSLVVIVRGVQGSGKSTFSRFLKLYAESIGLEAQICNADSFFDTPEGYRFDRGQLDQAHAQCRASCRGALARGVPVVIIDNTNVKMEEWGPYQRMARDGRHRVCRVSLVGDLTVEELLGRTWHNIPEDVIRRRLIDFVAENDFFVADYQLATRTDVFRARPDEEVERMHPMELMFFTMIEDQVNAFFNSRLFAKRAGDERAARKSLVFILRGLPGCGKSTFALQTKIYAQAVGFRTLVCSSDDYYRDIIHGFHFNPARLDDARAACLNKLRGALYRHVDVIVVDSPNITEAEYGPLLFEAQVGHVLFVNFRCRSMELAEEQLTRSFTHCKNVDRVMLANDFPAFQAARLPRQVIDIDPIFNAWDTAFITAEQNRATQA